MKKGTFDFINFGHVLGRSEMKKLMAGSWGTGGGCYEGSSNEEFCQQTGCEASFDDPDDKCEGSDGCTYNAAHSC